MIFASVVVIGSVQVADWALRKRTGSGLTEWVQRAVWGEAPEVEGQSEPAELDDEPTTTVWIEDAVAGLMRVSCAGIVANVPVAPGSFSHINMVGVEIKNNVVTKIPHGCAVRRRSSGTLLQIGDCIFGACAS